MKVLLVFVHDFKSCLSVEEFKLRFEILSFVFLNLLVKLGNDKILVE